MEQLEKLDKWEWQRPFHSYIKILQENPPEADIMALSDTELNDLIHQEREQESA